MDNNFQIKMIGDFCQKNQIKLAILVSFLFFINLHWYYDVRYFPHDAGNYWGLSDPAVFLNSKNVIRGYLFPLLLYPVRIFSDLFNDPFVGFRFAFSAIYALILPVLFANLFGKIMGCNLSLLRRLVPVFLLGIIFPGVLIYPLSDLPAILMLCGSLLFMLAKNDINVERRTVFLHCMMAGILAAAAYNTRTIYVFSLLAIYIYLLIRDGYGGSTNKALKFLKLSAFSLGVVLILLPQAFVNLKIHDKFTPVVVTNSLFQSQLEWGITLQRYETSIEPDVNPRVYYFDPAGIWFLNKISKENTIDQLGFAHKIMVVNSVMPIKSYLTLALNNPSTFLGIYFRHFINGLDVRDGLVYVKNKSNDNKIVSGVNFLIIIFFVLVIYFDKKSKNSKFETINKDGLWLLAIILIPVFCIIPGAIETRFFLPLHLLIYGFLAFYGNIGKFILDFKNNYIYASFLFFIIAGAFFAISEATMANIFIW